MEGCIEYPKPIGLIEGLEPFTGTTFFEFDVAQFSSLEFSIWANGGVGDCDSDGAIKLDVTIFKTEISELGKYLSSPLG